MSKITNDGLTRSDTGCFIAVPIWQLWTSKCSPTVRQVLVQLASCWRPSCVRLRTTRRTWLWEEWMLSSLVYRWCWFEVLSSSASCWSPGGRSLPSAVGPRSGRIGLIYCPGQTAWKTPLNHTLVSFGLVCWYVSSFVTRLLKFLCFSFLFCNYVPVKTLGHFNFWLSLSLS